MAYFKPILQDFQINIKIKLAVLWASLVFCYIYCDYFELYIPGKVEEIITGKSLLDSPLRILVAAIMMSIPSLMICFSIFLKPVVNRILNIFFGIFFTGLLCFILFSLDIRTHGFYVYFAIIEILITIIIIYTAFNWPRQPDLN